MRQRIIHEIAMSTLAKDGISRRMQRLLLKAARAENITNAEVLRERLLIRAASASGMATGRTVTEKTLPVADILSTREDRKTKFAQGALAASSSEVIEELTAA